MNVSLPDEMKAWVEDQARCGCYANARDYVRDPLRRDQERIAFRRLIEGYERRGQRHQHGGVAGRDAPARAPTQCRTIKHAGRAFTKVTPRDSLRPCRFSPLTKSAAMRRPSSRNIESLLY